MGRFSAALWAMGLTLGVALTLSAFDQKTEAQRANPPTTGNPPSSVPMGGNKSVTRFFVTSKGLGKGGDLGGLAGADAHCQALAQAQGAGDHTWRAYLSTEATATSPAVNARDRIGAGHWYNSSGDLIAPHLAALHGSQSTTAWARVRILPRGTPLIRPAAAATRLSASPVEPACSIALPSTSSSAQRFWRTYRHRFC